MTEYQSYSSLRLFWTVYFEIKLLRKPENVKTSELCNGLLCGLNSLTKIEYCASAGMPTELSH